MITIDKPIQAKNTNRVNLKSTVKKGADKTAFKDSISESSSNEYVNEIPEVNPFLFLHEIGEYKDDQEKLKEAGMKILECLNDIKLGLIEGAFLKEDIIKLKKVLQDNRSRFRFLELQYVIDDIVLRTEVELAKIEMMAKYENNDI